jgi:hypothetical protein
MFIAFSLLNVACNGVPKPFAQSPVINRNPLIVLAGGGAVKVEIDPALPKSLSEPLMQNMIESLWKENVPASGAMSFNPRYLLKGEIKILNSSLFEAEKAEIVWSLSEVKKKKEHKFKYKMFGRRPGWLLLDKDPLKNLPINMGKNVVNYLYKQQGVQDKVSKFSDKSEPLNLRSQITLPENLSVGSNNNSDDSLFFVKQPTVFIAAIVGAPGDGNNSLYKSMKRTLIIEGVNVVNDRKESNFLLNGFVNKSPTYGGLNDVAITWLVTTKGGKVVGKATQNNKILEGSLDQEWGKVAIDVALEGGASLVKILLRYLTTQNNQK